MRVAFGSLKLELEVFKFGEMIKVKLLDELEYYNPCSKPRFAKAMSSIRTRNARKVAKNAKKFLQSASKSSNSLDHRRAVNGHWLKHANLMPVLQFLAAKAEGL